MKTTQGKIGLIPLFALFLFSAVAQQDYNALYRSMDPARDSSDPGVKKNIHLEFLQRSLDNQDTLKIILGNSYLGTDYFIESDYIKAVEHFLSAADYASAADDTLWLGRMNHKIGMVYFMLENYQESIDQYQFSLEQSLAVGDSQYIAITLEQLGALYSHQGDFEEANSFYSSAIPLVKKYWGSGALSITYINYGNALSMQGMMPKAVEIYQKAIAAAETLVDPYRITQGKRELATVFTKMDSLQPAIEIYQECIKTSAENGWLNVLSTSYEGLSIAYEKSNIPDSALYYSRQHRILEDSIIGVETQAEINKLQKQKAIDQKEMELLAQKEEALVQKQALWKVISVIILILLVVSTFLWFFYRRHQRAKRQLENSHITLDHLSTILNSKDAELNTLRNKLVEMEQNTDNERAHSISDVNLFEYNILTDEDWQTFKSLFEKSYPNYLQKIRTSFVNISAAEERLFMLIKLQITNKEAASILGVQPETIKKTRSRLKKRLELEPNEKLNDFIQAFR